MAAGRRSRLLAPPWRALNPDGTLGTEYGPQTAATYARHIAKHRDWSYRAPVTTSARKVDFVALRAFMRQADGALRQDVPEGELEAYRLVVEQGMSPRKAGDTLGVSRRTIRVHLQRLADKVP